MSIPLSLEDHSTSEPRLPQVAAQAAGNGGDIVERVIMFADMEGYSRRVEQNEAEALEFMARCFDTFRVLAKRHDALPLRTLRAQGRTPEQLRTDWR